MIPVVEDYKGLGEEDHRAKSAAMNRAITAWATSSLPVQGKCEACMQILWVCTKCKRCQALYKFHECKCWECFPSLCSAFEALQRFTWKLQHSSCVDGAASSLNQRWAVVPGDEEPATPNEVSSYLDKLQATGRFPRDTPWRTQWRLMMSLEAIEPSRALKALRACHQRSLDAARCGQEFHAWEELGFDLDEALRSLESKKDHCPRDVRSALLKAREQTEQAEEEEDLFPDADMMQLLGELPCEQAAQLLQNHCANPQESMLYLIHSIATVIMGHQGGRPLRGKERDQIRLFLVDLVQSRLSTAQGS